ncbi:TolC family protein [Treponema lecithinolyticum]
MIKKSALVCLYFLCAQFLFSEEYDCEKLIEKVFEKSLVYKSAVLQYRSALLALVPERYGKAVQPFADLAYKSGVPSGDETSRQSHTFKTTFAVIQNIPGGISIQGEAANFFQVDTALEKPNQYEFSASLGVTSPLYPIAPDILPYAVESELQKTKVGTDIAQTEFALAEKRIRAQAVSVVGTYMLLKERLALEEKRQELTKAQEEADGELWIMGALSTFDMSERSTKRYEAYLDVLRLKQNFYNAKYALYELGLSETDVPEDIDVWIRFWENYVAEKQIQNGLEERLENKKLTLNFYTASQQHLASIPKLNFSASASPVSRTSGSSDMFEASGEYWRNTFQWNFNFTLSARIALSPVAQEYRLNRVFNNVYDMYKLSQMQQRSKWILKKEQYEFNFQLLADLKEKADRDKFDKRNKLITANTLLKNGYVTQNGFEYQKLNAELAENAYREVRLRCIAAALNGY